MALNLLSEIHDKSNQWNICVCVSRIWHFRGGTDDGPIKHTDLVLLDEQGNHMYGQIPPEPAGRLKDVLQEGRVYVIRKFFCNPSKPTWRPVESPYMVQFTRYSVIEQRFHLEETYPFCTYNLTPFLELPRPSSTPARFIDVIGRITMVSDIIPIQSMHQTMPSNTRTVVLQDLLENEINITLWGERAVEFDAEAVRTMGAKEPVVAIFVGTLPKMTYGTRSLSGSSACRWYIDEDVPDINAFRSSLGDSFIPLVPYAPSGLYALPARVHEEPTDATVLQLTNLDPFEDMNKRFFCVITVDRITPDKHWWFPSCGTCRKSARYNGYRYQCSDLSCASADAEITYCVSVMATDGTAEAEFVLFDRVAAGAVGKPLVTLMMQTYPGHATVQEAAYAARFDMTIPPDIGRLVARKYKFLVSISKKSQFTNMDHLSFQVSRIEKTFRPDLPPTVFGHASASGASSSSSVLPPGSTQIEKTIASSSQSSASQPKTPPPTGTNPAELTPRKSSQGVMRGARRSLFFASPSSKEKLPGDSASPSKEPLDASSVDAVPETQLTHVVSSEAAVPSLTAVAETLPADVVSSVNAPEEIEEPILALKNKRVSGAGKGGTSLKKTKQQ